MTAQSPESITISEKSCDFSGIEGPVRIIKPLLPGGRTKCECKSSGGCWLETRRIRSALESLGSQPTTGK
ncbi:MAG TPA: hypothetical protein VF828_00590 [Patescibacteria group bacterium]